MFSRTPQAGGQQASEPTVCVCVCQSILTKAELKFVDTRALDLTFSLK